jgi:hypothetical protein
MRRLLLITPMSNLVHSNFVKRELKWRGSVPVSRPVFGIPAALGGVRFPAGWAFIKPYLVQVADYFRLPRYLLF